MPSARMWDDLTRRLQPRARGRSWAIAASPLALNQATQNEEDGPKHGHLRIPCMMDLVKNGLQEYAEKVRKPQGWQGG